MAITSKGTRTGAPGACTDCGNDAYIRLAGGELVCAHCYGARGEAARDVRTATRPATSADAPSPRPHGAG